MKLDSLILSPTGRQLIRIGEHAHQQFTVGDYCVSIEWHHEARSCEPCMVIWPKYGGRGAGAFAICLSSASEFADPNGDATPNGLLECWKALPMLGRAQIDMEAFNLMDVVLRHIPDLIRCPVMPPDMRKDEAGEPLLEVRTVVNGQRQSEVVI